MAKTYSKFMTSAPALHEAGIAASLAASHVFSGLGGEDIAALATICNMRALRKREVLFREGERAEGFFVIQSGQISIQRARLDGRAQIIHVFGPGDSFAEAALARAEVYPASAVALKASRVIMVRKEPLLELLGRCPQLALQILASMSMHMRMLLQSIHDMKGRQIENRLAAWILKQAAQRGGRGAGGSAVVTLEMSKKVLAGQLGVTAETLSRTFARLREAGAISVVRKRIQIADRAALEELARGAM